MASECRRRRLKEPSCSQSRDLPCCELNLLPLARAGSVPIGRFSPGSRIRLSLAHCRLRRAALPVLPPLNERPRVALMSSSVADNLPVASSLSLISQPVRFHARIVVKVLGSEASLLCPRFSLSGHALTVKFRVTLGASGLGLISGDARVNYEGRLQSCVMLGSRHS
ncbi:hypothetical protein MTO96_001427 [Rhipicephalus appendiculatus]